MQMKIRKTYYLFGVIFLILGILSLSYGEKDFRFSLRLESFENNEVLLDYPLNPGEEFYLHYIHSSDKTPVWDTFRINDEGQLILIEEAFLWYGAGLEFLNHREIQLAYDGKWTKVRLNRIFPELVIRVGSIAKQRLIFQNRSIPLDTLVKPGEGIILSVTR